MLRRHASTMLSGVGPQRVSFVFFIHLEGIPCLRHSPFILLSFNIYELFALGMEQLMELLANCYSPELGLRCRPCCFSQNNSGASPSAVQVLSMRTAHMNLLDNTLSSFFLVTITMMASCIRDYTHSRLSICALASTTKGELVCPI